VKEDNVLRAIFLAWAFAAALRAQAAVEYAAKTAGGALTGQGQAAGIAGCRIDSNVLSCLAHSYPRAVTATVVGLCLLVFFKLVSGSRHAR
jgi:hypothetical protein